MWVVYKPVDVEIVDDNTTICISNAKAGCKLISVL